MSMTTINRPTQTDCPSWCMSNRLDCTDHWSDPGSLDWPAVAATGWAENDIPTACAHPSWGETDGLPPVVTLFLQGKRLDACLDLRPDEARRLAERLLAAAVVVEATVVK